MYEINLMMQEDRYVDQLQAYTNVLLFYAKEEAFKYLFINFVKESISFEEMSNFIQNLISEYIPKINVTVDKDKCTRWKQWTHLYKLVVRFYVYQFHNLFLLHDFHPKALDAEEFIVQELQNLEIPHEILEKNETAMLIANSKDMFQQNAQKGLSWAEFVCKN